MDNKARLCEGMSRKLYKASEWGNAQLLDEVLGEGINVLRQVTPATDTALHTASYYGHTPLASKLIQRASEDPEAGMQFLKAQNRDGDTALHLTAKGGYAKILRVLVEKNRDLACVKNKAGKTALFKASETGNMGMVESLLNRTPESEHLDTERMDKHHCTLPSPNYTQVRQQGF